MAMPCHLPRQREALKNYFNRLKAVGLLANGFDFILFPRSPLRE